MNDADTVCVFCGNFATIRNAPIQYTGFFQGIDSKFGKINIGICQICLIFQFSMSCIYSQVNCFDDIEILIDIEAGWIDFYEK